MNFSIKPMLVTPKYAEELLKMNTNNRKVRQSKVDSLADSMKKGEWELSNDAIVVSEGNVLLNGQHRLLAVVKSGVPCNFIVYTGAQESAYGIMDTPAVRSMSDVIQRMGSTNYTEESTLISRFMNLDYDRVNAWESTWRFHTTVQATRKECIETYEMYSAEISKWTAAAKKVCNKSIALISVASLAAFGLFLEVKMMHPEDKIKEFFKEFIVDGATKNSTILYARKKLLRHKMKIERLGKYDDWRFMIRAWNDFILGKESQSIVTASDSFHYIRPI